MATYLSYDAATWAWQTGTFGNDRLQTFFAGGGADPADTDPEAIPAYLQSLVAGVDVVFLMQPGDTVQKIELFDAGGSAAGDGNAPLELYVRYAGSSAWQRPALQTFDGSLYNTWRDIGAQEVVTAFRVRCLGKKATWFKRIRLSGTAGYVPKTPVARPGRLDNKNAVNSYWFNIFDPSNVHGPPPEADLNQLRQYSGWRFYLPQQDITDDDRTVRMYSARSGGAHYVELAQLLVQEGKFGVYSFMGNSRPNIATWTYTDSDGTVKTDGDLGSNAVWAKGADLYDPETYRHFGEFGWDMGAMLGSIAYPADQLRQATQPLNSYDPTPVVYTGLNLFGPDKITPQFGNELSKDWKNKTYPDGQQLNAYLPPDAAAIAYAVWRDGMGGTMGPRVGICAADPAIEPTIGILFTADPGYLHAFAEQLREIYGSNPDGSVKNFPLAADVHEYARDPQTGAGLPFSQSPLPARFAALSRVLDLVSPASTLVLSEYGYARTNAAAGNVDSGAYVSTGYSFLQPTSALPDPAVRRAAVLVDSVIELADIGVGQAYTYDDNHGFKTGTQDILWDLICDMNGELAQAWLNRLDQVAAGYARTSSTRQNGGLVARYAKAGASELVVLTQGATTLGLASATTVTPYNLATGALGTPQVVAAGGTYTRAASEVPALLLLSTTTTPTPGGGTTTTPGGSTGGGTTTPPPTGGGTTTPPPTTEPEPDPDSLVLLVALSDFKSYVAFSGSIAPLLVEPYIRDAQLHDVYPLLPAALRTELETDKANWSAATAKLFKERIRPLLVFEAAARMLLWHGTHVTPAGIEDLAQDGIRTPASSKRRAELAADLQAKAALYRAKLLAALPKPTSCTTPTRRPGRGGPSVSAL